MIFVIHIWISVLIIYFTSQIPKKYNIVLCYLPSRCFATTTSSRQCCGGEGSQESVRAKWRQVKFSSGQIIGGFFVSPIPVFQVKFGPTIGRYFLFVFSSISHLSRGLFEAEGDIFCILGLGNTIGSCLGYNRETHGQAAYIWLTCQAQGIRYLVSQARELAISTK